MKKQTNQTRITHILQDGYKVFQIHFQLKLEHHLKTPLTVLK